MNKVIWITGASTGIGAETARQMADQGWMVAVSARSEDKLKALATHKNIYAFPCDVTKIKQVKDTVAAIEQTHGPIEIAFLNAAMFKGDTFEDFTAANLKKHYEVNVFGVANGIEAVLPLFKERGRGHIAMTASVAGYMGLPNSISYGSTKAALINMAEALWLECRSHNVKVQLVSPGFVRTPMTAQNRFPMPMIIDVDEAARRIIAGFATNKFEITFLRRFSWILKTISNLVYPIRLPLVHWATNKAIKSKKPS